MGKCLLFGYSLTMFTSLLLSKLRDKHNWRVPKIQNCSHSKWQNIFHIYKKSLLLLLFLYTSSAAPANPVTSTRAVGMSDNLGGGNYPRPHMWLVGPLNPYILEQSWELTFLIGLTQMNTKWASNFFFTNILLRNGHFSIYDAIFTRL